MNASTAYHEAGHAVIATLLGGKVLTATIERDTINAPHRDGQVSVAWHRASRSPIELAEAEALAILAGPVAEMIHRGESLCLPLVHEWRADWESAWKCLAVSSTSNHSITRQLDRLIARITAMLQNDRYWQAISEVADLLDAHETIDGSDVDEVVRRWLTG